MKDRLNDLLTSKADAEKQRQADHERVLKKWKESRDKEKTDEPSAYDRVNGGEKASLSLMTACLRQSRDTGEPLPRVVLDTLIFDMALLGSGYKPVYLNKAATRQMGPFKGGLIARAAGYIRTSDDENAKQTVCDLYKVEKRTVNRWLKEFPPDMDNPYGDDDSLELLEISGLFYQDFDEQDVHVPLFDTITPQP